MERQWIFEAGEGWPCYRIPGLVRTASGVLIAYCETRLDAGDWSTRGVAARRSLDGGQTWQSMQQLVLHDREAVNNPIMIADRDGSVHFLWELEYQRLFYQHSMDDGASFDAARELTVMDGYRPLLDWTVFAVGPGHGIQTQDGALLVPIWIAKGEGRDHFPSTCSCLRSDDQGKTWQRGELVVPDPPTFDSPNETAVAACADGSLYFSIRNRGDLRCRYSMRSADGLRFSAPQAEPNLADPHCFGSVAAAGQALALVNCASVERRTNLTVRLSADNGRSFSKGCVLEDGVAGYADLAFSADGLSGFCLYERGAAPSGGPQGLCLARFARDELTDTEG